jgi:hypothetical protein
MRCVCARTRSSLRLRGVRSRNDTVTYTHYHQHRCASACRTCITRTSQPPAHLRRAASRPPSDTHSTAAPASGMAANCLPLCQLLRQAAGATSPRQLHSAYLASPYPALFAYHRIRRRHRCHLLPNALTATATASYCRLYRTSLHQATVQCSLGCRRTGTPS